MPTSLVDVGSIDSARSDRFRIVVCGEVLSGKSSVVNALLRHNVLPVDLKSTRKPLITVRHGDATEYGITYADGASARIAKLDVEDICEGAVRIDITTDFSPHTDFEIVELPLTKVEDVTDEDRAIVASADLLVWVTIASQAWRLTEKSIVESFAGHRPERCVIAVSRADKIRCDADRDRLMERISRETSDFFSDGVLIHGSRALIDKASESDDCWAVTNGDRIYAIARDQLEKRQARASPKTDVPDEGPMLLDEDDLAVVAVPVEPEHVTTEPVPASPALDMTGRLRAVVEGTHGVSVAGAVPLARDENPTVFAGDETACRAVAAASLAAYQATSVQYQNAQIGEAPHCIDISTASTRLLLAADPGTEQLVFLMGARTDISAGLAQTTLRRLSEASSTIEEV